MQGLLGKKLGMSQIFGEDGTAIPVTIIEAGPCYVTQVKTEDRDGYHAVQISFLSRKEKNVVNPLLGHYKKAGVAPGRILKEFQVLPDESPSPGDTVTTAIFATGDVVHVRGIPKGRGFAGVMKRHGFSGGQATHGQSDRKRAPGSIGQSSYPSRVFKGVKMGGRMGNKRVTVRNLKIVYIEPEKNLLFIRGAVPGPNQGVLIIEKRSS